MRWNFSTVAARRWIASRWVADSSARRSALPRCGARRCQQGPGLLSVPAQHGDLSALSVSPTFSTVNCARTTRPRRARPIRCRPRIAGWSPCRCTGLTSTRAAFFACDESGRTAASYQSITDAYDETGICGLRGRPHAAGQGTWRNWLRLRDDELRQFVITDTEAKAPVRKQSKQSPTTK